MKTKINDVIAELAPKVATVQAWGAKIQQENRSEKILASIIDRFLSSSRGAEIKAQVGEQNLADFRAQMLAKPPAALKRLLSELGAEVIVVHEDAMGAFMMARRIDESWERLGAAVRASHDILNSVGAAEGEVKAVLESKLEERLAEIDSAVACIRRFLADWDVEMAPKPAINTEAVQDIDASLFPAPEAG